MTSRFADWMRQARHDLEAARWMRQGGFFDETCFLAQQAAEKAAKALLEASGASQTGHSIAQALYAAPRSVIPEIPEAVRAAADALDPHYIAPRYPDALPSGAPVDLYHSNDAEEALANADTVLAFVEGQLGRLASD